MAASDASMANPPSKWTQLLVVLSYCLSSLLMLLSNKLVLSSYKFTASFFLLAVQCAATLALLEASRFGGLLQRRPFRWTEAKMWFPVSALLCAMIYTSTMALAHFSVRRDASARRSRER